ncbi:MAG TPA: MBOAT family O-acyltransferase [Chitinophagales bacterium]|nr:MBOAT family O-acyltransferase [Chitinophagales bacterium]
MVFSSLLFLFLFLPINVFSYYVLGGLKYKNIILIIFSLFFYAWGEPIWVLLLIFSALIDYINGLFIEYYRGKKIAQIGIYSTLFFNLGILGLFKYSAFFINNANALFSLNIESFKYELPIGISFYTFQTISYTIDVYYGRVKAQKSFLNFLMYVSLYPQLVAGPIVRYSHIAREINERRFNWADFNAGVVRFCIGLFKKVAIANVAGSLCTPLLDSDLSTLSVGGAWWGLLLFSLQIYFDFSGYSDMAIGLGRMFGFHFHENFRYPYLSASITDFWRRWHISLGSFFRDYVYIPLGGNKSNIVRNLFVVWALTGFWHGASWNFILWGLYFGLIILLEKLFIAQLLQKLPHIARHIYALFLIIFGWALFYFTGLERLWWFIKILFGATQNEVWNLETLLSVTENIYWLILAVVLCFPCYHWLQNMAEKHVKYLPIYHYFLAALSLLLFIVSVTLLVGSTYNPFLYFRF